MKKYTESDVSSLVTMGFCQPRFYTPSAWGKAKRFMDSVVVPAGFARPFNFGRGKGKYACATGMSIEDVKRHTTDVLRSQDKLYKEADGDC